jgi:tetratricopeptide (TPR) repeat protein
VASTLENLGNVYFEMDDFHQAKVFYEKALVIKKSKLGDTSTEIAITLNNLGNTSKHLNEVDKAQKFFTDALAILYLYSHALYR